MFTKKTTEELERNKTHIISGNKKTSIIIILDDVRSMHNVGSTFRTCDAFAVEAIYLCGYTPIPPHRDIHKTALGATETVKWQQFQDVQAAINEAKKREFVVYAVEQTHDSVELNNIIWDREQPIALVFGNEVSGVSNEALELCNGCIEIPQWGAKHSLNISVCVGVVIWELINNARASRFVNMLMF